MSQEIPEPDDQSEPAIKSTSDLGSTWKEAPKEWGHSIHALAPYVGSFPPELAHYFIRRYTQPGDVVLDPMCGGGTVPVEAAINGRHGWGNDSFAYANTLSTAKCNPLPDSNFETYLDSKLLAAQSIDNRDLRLLDNDDLRVFYSDYTLDKLLRLREIVQDDGSNEAAYLKGILCGILHGPSDRFLSIQTKDTYSGSVNYVQKYAQRNNLDRPERDIRPNALENHHLAQADPIPEGMSSRTKITDSDVRDLPYQSDSADLIITSPPYLAKLDYTWDNWIRLWWLGADRKQERDNLDLTQDIGKYRAFIRQALWEMYTVLSTDSRAILIVGDVQKRLAEGKRTINTARLIADEAETSTDFETQAVLEDSYGIDDRRYVVFNQMKYDYDDKEKDDLATIDRCLVLKKGDPPKVGPPDIDWDLGDYIDNK